MTLAQLAQKVRLVQPVYRAQPVTEVPKAQGAYKAKLARKVPWVNRDLLASAAQWALLVKRVLKGPPAQRLIYRPMAIWTALPIGLSWP